MIPNTNDQLHLTKNWRLTINSEDYNFYNNRRFLNVFKISVKEVINDVIFYEIEIDKDEKLTFEEALIKKNAEKSSRVKIRYKDKAFLILTLDQFNTIPEFTVERPVFNLIEIEYWYDHTASSSGSKSLKFKINNEFIEIADVFDGQGRKFTDNTYANYDRVTRFIVKSLGLKKKDCRFSYTRKLSI